MDTYVAAKGKLSHVTSSAFRIFPVAFLKIQETPDTAVYE
jgi:hypothetical protein